MIFHENRLLADDSHEISFLISFENWERCLQNLSSAAVVIGTLRVNNCHSSSYELIIFFADSTPTGNVKPSL